MDGYSFILRDTVFTRAGTRINVFGFVKFTTIAFATSYNYSPINNQSILLNVFMNV